MTRVTHYRENNTTFNNMASTQNSSIQYRAIGNAVETRTQ